MREVCFHLKLTTFKITYYTNSVYQFPKSQCCMSYGAFYSHFVLQPQFSRHVFISGALATNTRVDSQWTELNKEQPKLNIGCMLNDIEYKYNIMYNSVIGSVGSNTLQR